MRTAFIRAGSHREPHVPRFVRVGSRVRARYGWIAALLCVAACTTPVVDRIVPVPTDINAENVIVQVVKAFRAGEAESAASGSTSIGLNPCSVQITFNITAGGKENKEVVLDANVKGGNALVGAGVDLKNSNGTEYSGSRSNQIVFLLTSPECIPGGTLGATHPRDVASVAKQSADNRNNHGSELGTKVKVLQNILPGAAR